MTTTTQVLIKPIFTHDTYVFSKDFYNNTVNKSLLEALTTAYLQDDSIDEGDLKKIYNDVKNWNDLERFYYIPVLSFLTMYALDSPRPTWLNPLL